MTRKLMDATLIALLVAGLLAAVSASAQTGAL